MKQSLGSLKFRIFFMLGFVIIITLFLSVFFYNTQEKMTQQISSHTKQQSLFLGEQDPFLELVQIALQLPSTHEKPMPENLISHLQRLSQKPQISSYVKDILQVAELYKTKPEDYTAQYPKISQSIQRLLTLQRKNLQEQQTLLTQNTYDIEALADQNALQFNGLMVGIILLTILGTLTYIYPPIRRINQFIYSIHNFPEQIRQGSAVLKPSPLQTACSADEIAALQHAMEDTKAALGQMMGSLRESIHKVNALVQQDLQHFSELATATEEMGTTARTIAQTALEISHSANSTAEASRNGRSRLQQAVQDLNNAAERVREGVTRMESLATKVREVDQVVQIIRSIASQTNLLALNAAIEASRAGEAGKGFAVVAEEVRKLALQTSKSAENVIGLVQSIQDQTQEAVQLIQKIEQESSAAAKGAKASQEIFEQISENSGELANQIHGIAAATEEQRTTVENMSRKIAELFRTSEKSLRPEMEILRSKVEKFEI